MTYDEYKAAQSALEAAFMAAGANREEIEQDLAAR